jgi:UDP-glucose 4-epimerase
MGMKVLVIGGAGYIGSHMVKLLDQMGCAVTTMDDLSSGHRDAVLTGEFVKGDFGQRSLLDKVLAKGFDAVMHFASFVQVGESVQHPDKYYHNNFVNTLILLQCVATVLNALFFPQLRRPLASRSIRRLMSAIPSSRLIPMAVPS